MSDERKLQIESATAIVSAWLNSTVSALTKDSMEDDLVREAIKLLKDVYTKKVVS
jgi:hypothetical protein